MHRITAWLLLALTIFSLFTACTEGGSGGAETGKVVGSGDENLFRPVEAAGLSGKADDIKNLYFTLMKNKVPLLYVRMPYKNSAFELEGDRSLANLEPVDRFLAEEYIDTLDLAHIFDAEPEKYFYRHSALINADGWLEIAGRIAAVAPDWYSLLEKAPPLSESFYTREVLEGAAPAPFGGEREDYIMYMPAESAGYRLRCYGEAGNVPSVEGSFCEVVFRESEYSNARTVVSEACDPAYTGSEPAISEMPDVTAFFLRRDQLALYLSSTGSTGEGNVCVIHNLDDLSVLPMLADHFKRVTAIDARNCTSETVISAISGGGSFDLVITLLDPNGSYPPFSKNGRAVADPRADANLSTVAFKDSDRHLDIVYPESDVTQYVANTTALRDALAEGGTEFLFVQAPFRVLDGETGLPAGIKDGSNVSADKFIAGLADAGIDTVDLRKGLTEAVPADRRFFKTDHHWQPEAAFWGYQTVMKYLSDTLGWEVDPGGAYTDPESFTFERREHFYFGHLGKQFSQSYVGLDGFTLICPKFETSYEVMIQSKTKVSTRSGSYYDAVIDHSVLAGDDPGKFNRYCAYVSGDVPLVVLKNSKAYSDKKILVVKDSFSIVFNAFMSLNFNEVHVFDTRHNTTTTLTEYALSHDFDLVIMLFNPSMYSTTPSFFKFK